MIDFALRGYYHIDGSRVYQIRVGQVGNSGGSGDSGNSGEYFHCKNHV